MGRTRISEEESRRSGVMARVKAGELKQVEAAAMLNLSYRQTKRMYQRYLKSGSQGLVHRQAGKVSNRAKSGKLRRQVLELVRKHYGGSAGERFGPTLAAEHLAEDHGIEVDAETLRRWMLAEGLWTKERKRKAYRQRRMRRAHFGELVQMDGSFHAWLEARGPAGCLINVVDDATSKGLATITDEETTWAVADTLRAWVEKYGIPCALYVDWKTVYLVQATERQKQEGLNPVSQFGNMCGKLGIRLIGANSAQAKGRVERGHGTHQDRLIKKMRLKKFRTYEEANTFLRDEYLPQHNGKYAVEAREQADYHRSARGLDLNQIFCLEEGRKAGQDWVVRYHNRYLQIEKEQRRGVLVRAGSNVLVRQHRDGSLTLLLEDKPLSWHELPEAPQRVAQPAQKRHVVRQAPAPDHPWRKALRRAAKKP